MLGHKSNSGSCRGEAMNVSGKMEIAANSATILVAALLSVVLIKAYVRPPTLPHNQPGPQLAAGR